MLLCCGTQNSFDSCTFTLVLQYGTVSGHCSLWSRCLVDASWLNVSCLLPIPVKYRTCDPPCLSHTIIHPLHPPGWCWRCSMLQPGDYINQKMFKWWQLKLPSPQPIISLYLKRSWKILIWRTQGAIWSGSPTRFKGLIPWAHFCARRKNIKAHKSRSG